jgi:hypothetical protein
MHEGQEAFDRFPKAMKTIASVPKSTVAQDGRKGQAKKKKTPK